MERVREWNEERRETCPASLALPTPHAPIHDRSPPLSPSSSQPIAPKVGAGLGRHISEGEGGGREGGREREEDESEKRRKSEERRKSSTRRRTRRRRSVGWSKRARTRGTRSRARSRRGHVEGEGGRA